MLESRAAVASAWCRIIEGGGVVIQQRSLQGCEQQGRDAWHVCGGAHFDWRLLLTAPERLEVVETVSLAGHSFAC